MYSKQPNLTYQTSADICQLPPSFFTSVFGMNTPGIGDIKGQVVAAIIGSYA
jgi:hypothetical protein